MSRTQVMELIDRNVREHGFHVYTVTAGTMPRYLYTIGLRGLIDHELILAGAILFTGEEARRIVDTIGQELRVAQAMTPTIAIAGLGHFELRETHPSWNRFLLLGALDYYKRDDVPAYQVVPDEAHRTIDVPDLSKEWSPAGDPVWQWLGREWQYPVPRHSTATTNVDALRGARITEATRWGEDEWELFAGPGPDVALENARVVPLGSLLASDPSLSHILDLEIGKGVWRAQEGGDWIPWGR